MHTFSNIQLNFDFLVDQQTTTGQRRRREQEPDRSERWTTED